MKLTLIGLPWIFSEPEFKDYEGFSQNLGIGYLAAYAEKHGHFVTVIDAFAEGAHTSQEMYVGSNKVYVIGYTAEHVVNLISEDTDIIGISCPFSSQAFLIEIYASKIKNRFPDKLIVLGGPHAIQAPREALTENIDIVVRGEGEIALTQILDNMELSEIQGLVYRDGNIIKDNGLAPVVENMDELPFPARHLMPMEKYFQRSPRGGKSKEKVICMTTTRGCPFGCKFCSLHNLENDYAKTWRARSPENVMVEVDELRAKYGKISLQFEDDNILVRRDRAKELFRQLRTRNVKWAIHSGVMIQLLDDEMIRLMKESGCQQLNIALESGNQKVIKAMKKPMPLPKAEEAVKLCNTYKINALAFLMVGYPGETEETFQETLSFLKKLKSLGLKKVTPFIVNAHKGTPLFEESKEKGYLNLQNVENSLFNCDLVSIETEDFNEETVRRWVRQVQDLFCPQRAKIKSILRNSLGNNVYSQLIHLKRRVESWQRSLILTQH